jgi:hypothetical protein
VTAPGVNPKAQLTFLLGRHDPALIFEDNPDAPPDEYEAEQILARMPPGAVTEDQVRRIVRDVFTEAFGDDEGNVEELSEDAIRKAAHDIHLVLRT